jgi:hypothetical protein
MEKHVGAHARDYSPNLVEGEFSEVPLYGVLRSSGILAAFATMGARRSGGERMRKEEVLYVGRE